MKIRSFYVILLVASCLIFQIQFANADNQQHNWINLFLADTPQPKTGMAQAKQISLQGSVATVRYADGSIEKVEEGKFKLSDGRTIEVKNGRVAQAKKTGLNNGKTTTIGANRSESVGAND